MPTADRLRALVIAAHPGPSRTITAMVTVLAAETAPRGFGPALAAPAILAGQLSVGWSNDACDAARDAATGRTDKPLARGDISSAAVWVAAAVALAASAAVGLRPLSVNCVMIGAGWADNLGLKSSWASGLMYLAGFAPVPAFVTGTLPGHPWPNWQVTTAAGPSASARTSRPYCLTSRATKPLACTACPRSRPLAGVPARSGQ